MADPLEQSKLIKYKERMCSSAECFDISSYEVEQGQEGGGVRKLSRDVDKDD
jgi:hypothetical protein